MITALRSCTDKNHKPNLYFLKFPHQIKLTSNGKLTVVSQHIQKSVNAFLNLFWSPQGAKSRLWCRRQQRYHGWALWGWCLRHHATQALCCMLTSSPLHPALMSAGLPADGTSENNRGTKYGKIIPDFYRNHKYYLWRLWCYSLLVIY